jgi:hypothetical protein
MLEETERETNLIVVHDIPLELEADVDFRSIGYGPCRRRRNVD